MSLDTYRRRPLSVVERTNAMAFRIIFLRDNHKNMNEGEIAIVEGGKIHKYFGYMKIQTIVPGMPQSVLNEYDATTGTYAFLECLKSKVKEYYGVDVNLGWEEGMLSVILA